MNTPPILVAMAGLPGTGKSTLARKLAAHLRGTVIDKDEVRHALFPAPWTEYSAAQDDFVLTVMLAAAERLIATQHCPAVFIDGRTFSQSYQLDMVRGKAAALGCRMHVIECVCEPEVALARIRAGRGEHKAANRDETLYWRVRESFQAIPQPKILIDTGSAVDDARIAHTLISGSLSE